MPLSNAIAHCITRQSAGSTQIPVFPDAPERHARITFLRTEKPVKPERVFEGLLYIRRNGSSLCLKSGEGR
jgi:hypothetical protein